MNDGVKPQTAWELPLDVMLPDDPLTGCLVILTRLYHHPFSAQTLTAGLPLVNSRLTPDLFVRAAARANLTARVIKRPLKQVSSLTLPAVLLLKDGAACVVTARSSDDQWTVIQPESGAGTTTLSSEELGTLYEGYVIFSKPAFSTVGPSPWVMTSVLPVMVCSGMYSEIGRSETTTPAAWVPALRARPSICLARSRTSRIFGSLL